MRKTIAILLADGTPTGLLTAEIGNWTGKLVVVPRPQLDQLAKRPEATRTGVYVLVGPSPTVPGKERVYIGETDSMIRRLSQHDRDTDRDFWNRAIVVVSSNDSLTKTHVLYLEKLLIRRTLQAGRAELANSKHSDLSQLPLPSLPEIDEANMELFLSEVELVLPVLGFNFAKPVPKFGEIAPGDAVEDASPVFVMSPVGTHAEAQEIDGEFLVKAGSTARIEGIASWDTYANIRDDLIKSGKLVESKEEKGYYVFTQDVPFSSPSAAATAIYGGNQNGRLVWKRKDTGQTYGEWLQEKLEQAGVDDPAAGTKSANGE